MWRMTRVPPSNHRTSAGLLLVAGCLVGCSPPAPTGPARHVILITCDTLRADHLGCYGYGRPTSPHIDRLAAESVVFENAWSAAPSTGPSLSSLLTGRFPDEVGATPTNDELMPEEVVTLAEVARDAGLRTAAFVSNGVLRRPPASYGDIGVQQGFQTFDDEMNSRETHRNLPERTADECTDAVLRWLGERSADEPFFLWVHYQDPHGPYTPPEADLALFARDASGEAPLQVGTNHSCRGQIPAYQRIGDERRPGPYVDRYDAEIRFFDAQLGRLLDGLRQRGLDDGALIAFTADHGESLGEHGCWFGHGESVQRELVRVPLLVRYPQALRTGPKAAQKGAQRVDRLVMHLDLFPTFVEALGLNAAKGRGTSLLAAEVPVDRVAPQFLGPLRNPKRRLGVTDGRWRAVLIAEDAPQLFDLSQDPGENHDLAAQNQDVLVDLQARYTTFMASDMRPRSKAVRVARDSGQRADIEKLGYTEGGDGH